MDNISPQKRCATNLLVSILLLVYAGQAISISSKAQSIKDAKLIYQEHPYTFFCQKPIQAKGYIYERKCDTCPLSSTKIKWMNIIPSKRLAKNKPCLNQALCLNSSHKAFKGISCCRKIDKEFVKMDSDLHNIVPEEPLLSKLNAKASIGKVPSLKGQYICDLRYSSKNKLLQPPIQSQGMLARTYLYYESQYQLKLSKEERELFILWHYQNPPSEWEKLRNTKIYASTGKRNSWIH